ncbi:MAG: ketol-acid reductoisomerase [Phycisphaerales bacterium]|jgi:ketol-acid reductoisomerase|nr:ketol-acid reductoisomerase [Phycisphaerales bacterium]
MPATPLTILSGPEQVPLAGIVGKTITLIGYGNQGIAHALNLRDSGVQISVATRNQQKALDDGFPVVSNAEAANSDLIILALPDEIQGAFFTSELLPHLQPNATLGFIHGFSIRYGHITPPKGVGVVMVAPKGPGVTVRDRFLQNSGVPALLAIEQENSSSTARSLALGWAAGIGSGSTAVIETTFAHETETDLFGEQSIIVGGLVTLVKAAFETLVNAGYPPELAYIECCHEVKQVADIMHEKGISKMMAAISNTAEMGAYEAMDLLDDEHLHTHLRTLLQGVKDGSFSKRLVSNTIKNKREELGKHAIEQIGKEIRSLMHPKTD